MRAGIAPSPNAPNTSLPASRRGSSRRAAWDYAEYVRVMSFVLPGVVKIPARNTFAEGAMQEPVNTVLKAVNRLTLQRGDIVLVAGQGPIGLMFTRLLALRGMKVIASDLMETRLKFARAWGARWSLQADRPGFRRRGAANLTRSRGVDAAVMAVPSAATRRWRKARRLLRGAGQLLLFCAHPGAAPRRAWTSPPSAWTKRI